MFYSSNIKYFTNFNASKINDFFLINQIILTILQSVKITHYINTHDEFIQGWLMIFSGGCKYLKFWAISGPKYTSMYGRAVY